MASTLAFFIWRSEVRKNAEAENVSLMRSFHPLVSSPVAAAEAVKPRSCPHSAKPCNTLPTSPTANCTSCLRKLQAVSSCSFAPWHLVASSPLGFQQPNAMSTAPSASYGCEKLYEQASACRSHAGLPPAPLSRASRFPHACGGSKPLTRLNSAGCKPFRLATLCVMPQAASSASRFRLASVMPHAPRHLRCRSAATLPARHRRISRSHLQFFLGGSARSAPQAPCHRRPTALRASGTPVSLRQSGSPSVCPLPVKPLRVLPGAGVPFGHAGWRPHQTSKATTYPSPSSPFPSGIEVQGSSPLEASV